MASSIRDIRYLNKDFASLRNALIDYSKIYFPNTYSDFSETSPGMMFIEMAAYVGDVLSYYLDYTFKELIMPYTEEKRNIYTQAQMYGYPIKVTSPSVVELSCFQIIPASGSSGEYIDDRYFMNAEKGMTVLSSSGVSFITSENCNFADLYSPENPVEISIYEVDQYGNPLFYLLKKKIKAISGEEVEYVADFGEMVKYNRVTLFENNVIEITSVIDSEGNEWYEVPSLAQDTIFTEIQNPDYNTQNEESNKVPYYIKLKKVPRRFVKKINSNNQTVLIFGAGSTTYPDETIIPTSDYLQYSFGGIIDPSNFLKTRTYGLIPTNTSLTIKYIIGGGINSNIQVGEISKVSSVYLTTNENITDLQLLNTIKNSFAVINEEPALGGGGEDTIEEIKNNMLTFFSSQNRAVTKEDYISRVLSMPPKYGKIAKVFISHDDQYDPYILANPLEIQMYCLGYDAYKKLTILNTAAKENIKTYLSPYRMLTDAIRIRDAYIINIKINFEILVKPEFNKREVVLRCINVIKDYFNIDNWQIGQPIYLADLSSTIQNTDGVKTVVNLEILNAYSSLNEVTDYPYSNCRYDITLATIPNTISGIIYTSQDPSIFEIKYPDIDIKGKAL